MGDTSMQKAGNPFLDRSPLVIFALIGLAIMGGSLYSAYRTAARARRVAAWPTTPAYVIESRIEWGVRAHDRAGSTSRSYSYEYQLPVLAGYRVDGEYYTSSTPAIETIRDQKLYPRDPWRNPPDEDIVALFRQVPQGAMVPIHYNPEKKDEAYVFSNVPFWTLYSTNVLFFCFGVLPFLFWLIPVLLSQRCYGRGASSA